jgi:hypothetical protein
MIVVENALAEIWSRAGGATKTDVLTWIKSVLRGEASAMSPVSGEETELEMTQRHVRQGADHVAGQRALIARLRADGLPTEEAEALLVTFKDPQAQHEAHLSRIKGS